MDTTRPADGPALRSLEVEQALLGTLLVYNRIFDEHCAELRAEHFSEPVHARIYEAAATLIAEGRTANPITVAPAVAGVEGLTELGGAPVYLARLVAHSAMPAITAPEYARLIRDRAARRAVVTMCWELAQRAADADADIRALVGDHIEAATAVLDAGSERRVMDAGMVAAAAIDQAAGAYQAGGRLVGVTWGLTDLDRRTGGLHPGQLVILAGRPGQGKSTVATAVARRAARAGHGTLVFSLEMSASELGMRLVADASREAGAGIEYSRMRRGRFGEEEWPAVVAAGEALGGLPLYVDDRRGLTVADIAARARAVRARMAARGQRLGLVVVDYLQLVRPSERYAGSRVNEIGEISYALKSLAGDLDCAVLALSQLSRDVERREDKRPQLSDLRDSGSLEQDADVVMFVYRDEYYLGAREPKAGTSEHLEWQERMKGVQGLADLIVAKQRNGSTGAETVVVSMAHAWLGDRVRDGHQPDREGELWG